ncbi:MAG: hypothetical protein K2W96_24825 [Gemmataceae bacterium]|nr:hypothetical protein [Gemmataceae bacterium]
MREMLAENSGRLWGNPAWRAALVFVATLAVVPSLCGEEPSRGDKGLLQLVASEYRANRTALRTWQGKVRIRQEATGGAKARSPSLIQLKFAWDHATSRYSFLAEHAWGDPEIGTATGLPRDMRWGAIRTPEGYFHITPWKGDDGQDAKRKRPLTVFDRPTLMIGPPATESRGDFSPDFDPLYYLEIRGEDAHPWLMELHEHWQDKKFEAWRVSRAANLVTVSIERPADPLKQHFVFDLDKGGNMVSSSSRDRLIEAERARTFKKISGVWVPAESKVVSKNTKSGVTTTSEVDWTENLVNKPVPPGSFSLAGLGMKTGDNVSDHRTGSHSKFDEDADLEKAAKADWTRMLMIVGMGSVAVVAALLWWRRRPRSTQESANG